MVNSTGLLALQLGSRLLVAQSFKFFFVITAHLQKLVAMHHGISSPWNWGFPNGFPQKFTLNQFRELPSGNGWHRLLKMAQSKYLIFPAIKVDLSIVMLVYQRVYMKNGQFMKCKWSWLKWYPQVCASPANSAGLTNFTHRPKFCPRTE